MAFDAQINTYSGIPLIPLLRGDEALTMPVALPPSKTYARGTVLALSGSAAVNAVQTWTESGSPGSGSFGATWVIDGQTFTMAPVAYNAASTTTLQNAIRAAFGGAHATATGSAGGPYSVTYIGKFAGRPIPAPTFTNTFNQGSIASATATAGVMANTFDTFDATLLAQPATAPTVAGNGSGSSFGAGTYLVQYTLVTAGGESTPSPGTAVTVTAAQNLRVTSITSLSDYVTKVRFYVNGVLAKEVTPTANATGTVDIDGAALTVKGVAPDVNTAYSSTLYTAACILKHPCATDADGRITWGSASGGSQFGVTYPDTPAYVGGFFDAAKLTGMTAKALADMGGRIVWGNISTGCIYIPC